MGQPNFTTEKKLGMYVLIEPLMAEVCIPIVYIKPKLFSNCFPSNRLPGSGRLPNLLCFRSFRNHLPKIPTSQKKTHPVMSEAPPEAFCDQYIVAFEQHTPDHVYCEAMGTGWRCERMAGCLFSYFVCCVLFCFVGT